MPLFWNSILSEMDKCTFWPKSKRLEFAVATQVLETRVSCTGRVDMELESLKLEFLKWNQQPQRQTQREIEKRRKRKKEKKKKEEEEEEEEETIPTEKKRTHGKSKPTPSQRRIGDGSPNWDGGYSFWCKACLCLLLLEGTRFFRVETRVLNSKSTSTLSAHKSRVSKTQVAIMDLSLINSRC